MALSSLRSTFLTSRLLFSRALAAIFFIAFASLGVQIRGLLGERGIAPAGEFLQAAARQLGGDAWLKVPTLCWFSTGDTFLVAICILGCLVAALLAAGFAPGACCLALWGLYLSLCSVGAPFLNFQWDALLLETAFLAVFYLPWKWRPDWTIESPVQRIARWLLAWLLFRLMIASAVVKLSSGDPVWRSLSALQFHFETQPLPLWTAWYLQQLPHGVLRAMELSMFAIEFLAPLLIVAPRKWRHAGAGALILLQVVILTSGNYAFFNWLTIALCLPLIDDDRWPRRWRERFPSGAAAPVLSPGKRRIFSALAALPALLTTMALVDAFRPAWSWPRPLAALREAVAPLRSFNGYGLFAVMTTQRPEISVEGSDDGVNWSAYRFRWKPGNPQLAPRTVAPHQPRLDWQMWFAALGDVQQNPWFVRFLIRLLEGSPEVVALLEWNPFPRQPPRYVRAVVYDYRFTRWGEPGWWKRGEQKLYCPPISLRRE